MRNNLLLLALCSLIGLGGCGGCCLIGGLTYCALQLAPAPAAVPAAAAESAYWSALADFLRNHPERFEDTDRVYKIAMELESLGCISSLERLARWKDRAEPITDLNRNDVLAALASK